MSQAKYGKIDQLGIIVDDVEEAMKAWTMRITGDYRGQPTSVTCEVAMGYQGEMQIELMQITNNEPSPYRNDTGELLRGVHHIAWLVDDLDAAVEQAVADGMRLVFKAGSPGTNVAYLETDGQRGMMFEFIESPITRELIASGIAATKIWDGSDPVTIVDMAAV